jgi:hypothetical protein
MKNIFITALLMFALDSTTQAQNAEVEAVKKAIENESYQYHNNPDRMAFANAWHTVDGARMVYASKEGVTTFSGAEMRAAVVAGQMPKADNVKTTFSNYVVRVSGNVAWAAFDQSNDGGLPFHEVRCMEKIDGEWKIIASSVINPAK